MGVVCLNCPVPTGYHSLSDCFQAVSLPVSVPCVFEGVNSGCGAAGWAGLMCDPVSTFTHLQLISVIISHVLLSSCSRVLCCWVFLLLHLFFFMCPGTFSPPAGHIPTAWLCSQLTENLTVSGLSLNSQVFGSCSASLHIKLLDFFLVVFSWFFRFFWLWIKTLETVTANFIRTGRKDVEQDETSKWHWSDHRTGPPETPLKVSFSLYEESFRVNVLIWSSLNHTSLTSLQWITDPTLYNVNASTCLVWSLDLGGGSRVVGLVPGGVLLCLNSRIWGHFHKMTV